MPSPQILLRQVFVQASSSTSLPSSHSSLGSLTPSRHVGIVQQNLGSVSTLPTSGMIQLFAAVVSIGSDGQRQLLRSLSIPQSHASSSLWCPSPHAMKVQ